MEPEATAASSDARDLAVRARDRVRFEEDALVYADDAYRVARRLTGSTEAAEELVQDAYVRAFRSGSSTRPARTCARGSCASCTTSRSTPAASASGHRRWSRWRRATLPLPAHGRHIYTGGGRNVVERLSQGGVVSALGRVPQPYRDAVVLVDLADFSYQDAADILDVPIGTIMSRLHRGRRMLKTELAQTIEDTAEAAAS